MAAMQKKNLAKPDETRKFDKGLLELVTLGGVTFGRGIFQPGWRWPTSVKPLVKTERCEAPRPPEQEAGVVAVGVKCAGGLHRSELGLSWRMASSMMS